MREFCSRLLEQLETAGLRRAVFRRDLLWLHRQAADLIVATVRFLRSRDQGAEAAAAPEEEFGSASLRAVTVGAVKLDRMLNRALSASQPYAFWNHLCELLEEIADSLDRPASPIDAVFPEMARERWGLTARATPAVPWVGVPLNSASAAIRAVARPLSAEQRAKPSPVGFWKQRCAQVADAYASLREVGALLAVGSVARGWADEESSLSFWLGYTQPVPMPSRRLALAGLSADPQAVAVLGPVDHGLCDSVHFCVEHYPLESLVERVRREHHSVDPSAAEFFTLVRDATLWRDRDRVLSEWQKRLRRKPYPYSRAQEALRQTVTALRDSEGRLRSLAEKKESVRYYLELVPAAIAWYRALILTNHQFFPGLKWSHRIVPSLALQPERCWDRLGESLCCADLSRAWETFSGLLADTISLARIAYPDLGLGD